MTTRTEATRDNAGRPTTTAAGGATWYGAPPEDEYDSWGKNLLLLARPAPGRDDLRTYEALDAAMVALLPGLRALLAAGYEIAGASGLGAEPLHVDDALMTDLVRFMGPRLKLAQIEASLDARDYNSAWGQNQQSREPAWYRHLNRHCTANGEYDETRGDGERSDPGLYRYIAVIESGHEWTPDEIMSQSLDGLGLRMASVTSFATLAAGRCDANDDESSDLPPAETEARTP